MGQEVLPDSIVKDVAAESNYTADQLRDALESLHDAMRSRFADHFRECRLRTGSDYLALRLDGQYWFALTRFDLFEESRKADLDIDKELLILAGEAHLNHFQYDMGFTISIPLKVARQLKEPFHYPIKVDPSEDWREGQYHAYQRFAEFVGRHDMTAAEALDTWVMKETSLSSAEWAGHRGVDPEAVRKNVRQGKEKYRDPDLGASRDDQRIVTEKIEELPDGDPIDRDEDRVYVPTEGKLDEYRDSIEE